MRLLGAPGATLGFHSMVTFLPEAGLGVVVLTNASAGVARSFITAVTFRLLELVFDLPAAFDATVSAGRAAVVQARAELLAQLGPVDPAAVRPYLGRWANPDLGEATLRLRAGTLDFTTANLRSELRPQEGADGVVAGYLFLDPPLSLFPPELTVHLERDAAGGPRLVLTATADPGEADVVYPFAPIAAATPTP